MKRARAVLLIALGLLPACGPDVPWPEPPNEDLVLRAEVEPDSVALLQSMQVRVDLFSRGAGNVVFDPAVPDGFVGEVRQSPPVPWGGGTWRRALLLLRPARGPGELTIPPFIARREGGSEARSPELTVQVTTVLEGHGAGLEAPGDPFAAGFPWAVSSMVAGGVLAAGGLWWFLARRRRRAPLYPDGVPLPSHVRAQRELLRLRGMPRRTPAEVDAFYTAVSSVLRHYLEERFGLRAPERTTEEFLGELEAFGPLDGRQRQDLRAFLGQCDLVKFAAQVPGEAVHLATLDFAERFVEATRPDRSRAEPVPAPRVPQEVSP